MNWTVNLGFFLVLLTSPCAVAQHTVAEQYLFQSINQERASAGLAPLAWNDSLTRAATFHAQQMRAAQAISHQFRGEPDLAQRAAATGTRFSRVAENVATSVSVLHMHLALMQSQHHRENILDPAVTSVGIAVLASGRQFWGVEDFARNVQALTYGQQEAQVAHLVAATGVRSVGWSDDARATCSKATGYTGARPAFVMRFTATELSHLPAQLTTRIAQGGITQAAIGACAARQRSNFTAYSIAIILYP